MGKYTHLPWPPFRRPRQNEPQLLNLGRFQRVFLRRIAAYLSLSQDDPALCDGIFAKFHSVSLAGIARGSWPLFEAVAIPDGAFAGEVCHFEVLRQLQSVHRASIFAESAEHAPRRIISKARQHFPARGVVALPAHHDEVLRTG